jgi:hypothetical protein
MGLQGHFGDLGELFGRDDLIGIDIVSIQQDGWSAEGFCNCVHGISSSLYFYNGFLNNSMNGLLEFLDQLLAAFMLQPLSLFSLFY